MAEQLTINKIKDSYIAYINAHYVSDEDARRIKDEFDRLRAENAKLRELCKVMLRCRNADCDECPMAVGVVLHSGGICMVTCIAENKLRELGIEVPE